ncbi:MAG: hypothetical protein RIR18_2006 [Pseudomonadota bacterium]|jgi:sigma-E factor negative regulatory protein RseC
MTQCHHSNTPHDHQSAHSASLVETRGSVERVEGDRAFVLPDSQGCGRCHEPGGCGGQSLIQLSSHTKTYEVLNTIDAQVGDRVSLMVAPDIVRKAALAVYVFPLVLCILGATIGQFLGGDLFALGGAFLGIALGWVAMRHKQLEVTTGPSAAVSIRRVDDRETINAT